jgi:hypothetical protein
MKRINVLLLACLLAADCTETSAQTTGKNAEKEFFVGVAVDQQKWPYRYTLVRTSEGWSGEIEFYADGRGIFFATIDVVSSTDDKITFDAPIGGPGKALPMSWEISLTKSKDGFDGVLNSTPASNNLGPIKLHLASSRDAVLPSSKLPAIIKAMDDSRYRTDAALLHEVDLAKQEWDRESAIASRIAKLRNDDTVRGGVRREWLGPDWVRGRLKPEQSRYFERICCVYLGGTSVTDEDVLAISDLREMRELFLYRTAITDAALARIDRLRALRVLALGHTSVSDQGLDKLGTLANLKELYLNETKVSDKGGNRLRSQLRDAKIEW